MKWFRYYSSTVNDPKVQRLSPHLFKFWVNLLSIASGVPHRGILPPVGDLAFQLRMSEERIKLGIDELVASRLLDRLEDQIQIHNWDKWQRDSDDAAARMRRTRAENVPNTFVPRGDTEENKRKIQRRGRSTNAPDPEWLAKRYQGRRKQAIGGG